MDNPDAARALAMLHDLRGSLQAEVTKLETKHQELEGELQGVDVELEAKRRMLGLVDATEQQLSHQQAGLSRPEDLSVKTGTEVRGGGHGRTGRSGMIRGCSCCDSSRQRLLTSDPSHPCSIRSPSPREPSLWPCGRTTYCRS
jgi:hypothetical protein